MTYDPTRLTLGALLSSDDTTIKRNAMSILKVIQKCDHAADSHGDCIYCFKKGVHAKPLAHCDTHSLFEWDCEDCERKSNGL